VKTEIVYDPYDYTIDADPHPVWKRMRDEAPVYWNEQYQFWALSRFADVYDASRDVETFSSARGRTTRCCAHW
jgi:cytochrome P450